MDAGCLEVCTPWMVVNAEGDMLLHAGSGWPLLLVVDVEDDGFLDVEKARCGFHCSQAWPISRIQSARLFI